jgi:hypothetical protein
MKIKQHIKRLRWNLGDLKEWLAMQGALFLLAVFVVGYAIVWFVCYVGIPVLIFLALWKYLLGGH